MRDHNTIKERDHAHWPSIDFLSDNEDFSTGHAATDPKRLNSVMYLGPPPEAAIDLTGTGWTSPAARWRLNVSHEIAHSFPPGESRGPLTELWSAAAEALNGIHDTSASAEVAYTWSLLSETPDSLSLPSCTDVRRSNSNYQARTSFMAYVAYNFLNADSARTIAGSADDLLSRWAKAPAGNRTLASLQPFLSDANCATCASASYFRSGTTALSNRERMNVLIHNWRVANFVNAPNLAERQFGYPAWAGFSPAANLKAWQSIDGCATDDIVALPAIMTIGAGQLTRDMVLSGQRTFRGASYPLSLVPFGSNYWVIRADPSITTANRDLVVRIIPEGTVNCGGFALSLVASAVAYTTADATGDESTLWQNPSGASVATAVQMTDVDSATTAIEVVIPNFGLTNRSAVLVLTAGDGPVGNFSGSQGLRYGEALPYRIEAGLRTAPFQPVNPLVVSARPELPEGMPTWSPTGNEVAYYSVDPIVSSQPQIFRRPLDGSPAVALATQVAEQLAPDWSPRGDAIAFESVQIGETSSRVWIADLVPGATATLRQLTTLPGCASMPTFQPNGRGLVYTHIPNPTGDAQCYLRWISLDGLGDGLIAHLGGPTNFHRKPRWSADGKTIYFPIAEQGDRVVAFPWQGGAGIIVAKLNPSTVNLDLHPGSGRIAVESWATPINGIVNVPLPINCPGGGPQIASHRIAFQDTLVAGSEPVFRVSDRVNFAHQPAYSPDGIRIAYQSQNRFTSNGSIEVRQISWNHPPVFTSGVDDQALTAGVPFQVTLQAVDPDGEPITFKADYLPPGATLYAGNTFRWLNPGSGDFFPVFRTLDGSGGVAKRVVRFTVVSDGGNGDPFRDGDGGCTACAISPGLAASMNAGDAGESAGNSYLNGALPGAWMSTTSRVTRIVYDAGDNLSVNLNAPLPGMVTLDRAHLLYVEHAPTERAIATSAGVLVGDLGTVASVLSSTGEDILQALLPMAATGGAMAIPAGSKLEVRWSPEANYSAIVVDCAHTGSGWGDGSGIEVQVPVDGAWLTIDRVIPRQGFDLVGANIGTATDVRLVFLADAQL